MTDEEVVNPEWFYHPSFVTPAIFKPGSRTIKGRPRYNPPKREQPKLKEKQKTQKTTEEGKTEL